MTRQEKLELIDDFRCRYIDAGRVERMFGCDIREFTYTSVYQDRIGLQGTRLELLECFRQANKSRLSQEDWELIGQYIDACILRESV